MSNEYKITSDSFILSKTDLKGIITYCNDSFLEASEYKLFELIKKNHNIIRHPDMPKTAYKIAWDLLEKDKDFYGFIKNKRKNGGYYWVFTYISPDYINGKKVGYTSIRRKINSKVIPIVESLYKDIRLKEKITIKNGLNYLDSILEEKKMNYNEFIVSLQREII